jgi:hypothetical protein
VPAGDEHQVREVPAPRHVNQSLRVGDVQFLGGLRERHRVGGLRRDVVVAELVRSINR